MIIGINLLFLIPGKVGGTEVFARNIVEGLSKYDKKNKYILYLNKENSKTFRNLPKNFSKVTCNFKGTDRFKRVLWEQLVLPLQCYSNKVNVLHSLGYTSPLFTHCPRITTIYDLNYHFFPEDFSWIYQFALSKLIPLVAKRSNKIIVHSNKSKSEMIKVLGVDEHKIEVAYGGVPEDFKKEISIRKSHDFILKYGVKTPYILANATLHPHKNLVSLVVAFLMLIKNPRTKHNLVLIGIRGRAHKEIDEIVESSEFKNRIVFTNDWIDHKNMKYFNKLADIFVVPSLYEGFGLPTAEAMACGTPVIASKYSCTPEIVGNGGLVIDVKKPNLIAKAINNLLTNKNKRLQLSKLGKERSKMFSWKKLAMFCLKLYEKESKNV